MTALKREPLPRGRRPVLMRARKLYRDLERESLCFARARLADHALEDLEVIFRALPDVGSSKHFGSRLLFDRAGFLYVTAGERGLHEIARIDGALRPELLLYNSGSVGRGEQHSRRVDAAGLE